VLGCVPLIAAAGALQLRLMLGFNQKSREAYENSGKIASETVENIRTVVSLCREDTFQTAYEDSLAVPNAASRFQAITNGLSFGYAQMIVFFIWAGSFYLGGWLVQWGDINFGQMMQSVMAILFGSFDFFFFFFFFLVVQPIHLTALVQVE